MGSWTKSTIGKSRGGFSLIEIVIALAILVTIAATVTPVMMGALDRSRMEEGLETLLALAGAVNEFEKDVTDYPSLLTQLTEPISSGDHNSCGSNYGSGNANGWRGPYLPRIIPESG